MATTPTPVRRWASPEAPWGMRIPLVALLVSACTPASIVQDTGALRPPCEPTTTSFSLEAAPVFDDVVAVEHHLGLCIDEFSTQGLLLVRRTGVDATCIASLSFAGAGETQCPSCEGAWEITEVALDTDCPDVLADATLGPEDLAASSWIGWALDGKLYGDVAGTQVELPAASFDYIDQGNGPNRWIDVYGSSQVTP